MFGFGASGGSAAPRDVRPQRVRVRPQGGRRGRGRRRRGRAAAEAECKAEFTPLVKLEKVEVASGEENEDVLFEAKSKSYRFVEGEWKERV